MIKRQFDDDYFRLAHFYTKEKSLSNSLEKNKSIRVTLLALALNFPGVADAGENPQICFQETVTSL